MSEHGGMNIDQQKGSWSNFVKLFTYSTVSIAVLLIIMAATLV